MGNSHNQGFILPKFPDTSFYWKFQFLLGIELWWYILNFKVLQLFQKVITTGQNPSISFSLDIAHQIMNLAFSGELKQKWLKKNKYNHFHWEWRSDYCYWLKSNWHHSKILKLFWNAENYLKFSVPTVF